MGVMGYVLGLGVPLVLGVAFLPLSWLWLAGMTRSRGPWQVLAWTFYVLFMAASTLGCVRFYALDALEGGFFAAALLLYAGALASAGIARAVRHRAPAPEQERGARGGDGA